ncbi:MAG TPA: type I 3-dehydroquinate dehydratase [Phycisphaerae bacterium]|nr:type I 3-dehydroquinate dehydratase [Phycisphaerae bacterium]
MKTLLAVPITSLDRPPAEQVRAATQAGADLVELRVDCIADADGQAGIEAVETLLSKPHSLPFILTVRSADEGGLWDRDEAERIALIERLALRQPGYVDVEYSAWSRSANLRQKLGLVCEGERRHEGGTDGTGPGSAGRTKNRLILSYHQARGTPAIQEEVLGQLAAAPAAVIKVVFAARDATDACRVLGLLHRHASGRAVIALALGEAGLASRVLARKFGAFLTFAALAPGAESAPGQPTVQELRELYRWDRIGAATRVYGLVGWPVAHSRGSHVHNAAMAAEGIDGVYLPLPVAAAYDDFCAFMDFVTDNRWLDVAGLSVTLPHKQHALRWLAERGHRMAEPAQRCGAVNTLVRTPDGGWTGENTDTAGVLAALETVPELAGDGLRGRHADVLGAGGAARAVVAALLECGCRVTLYNRTPERAARLAQRLGCAHAPWEERRRCRGSVLINCTSVGMWPEVGQSPMPAEGLRSAAVVMDTVYNPPETRLLREACVRGCRLVGGSAMYIGQAVCQYVLWHARPAPRAVMHAALTG